MNEAWTRGGAHGESEGKSNGERTEKDDAVADVSYEVLPVESQR